MSDDDDDFVMGSKMTNIENEENLGLYGILKLVSFDLYSSLLSGRFIARFQD